MKLHFKARTKHPEYPNRIKVADSDVDWRKKLKSYTPVDFTHNNVVAAIGKWADNNWINMTNEEKSHIYHRITYALGRRRLLKSTLFKGKPRNPIGRTGMKGRGLLGKYGVNHAADPIVTRFYKGKLQVVLIKRRDTGELALPGGMTEGQSIPLTLKKEFLEEALRYESNPHLNANILRHINNLFDERGDEIYKGYVDDPRNTDDAWMETKCVHFHMDSKLAQKLPLLGGDDASTAMWKNVNSSLQLYANHMEWVTKVSNKMRACERLRSFRKK